MSIDKKEYTSPIIISEALVITNGFNEMSPTSGDEFYIEYYDPIDIYTGENSGSMLD